MNPSLYIPHDTSVICISKIKELWIIAEKTCEEQTLEKKCSLLSHTCLSTKYERLFDRYRIYKINIYFSKRRFINITNYGIKITITPIRDDLYAMLIIRCEKNVGNSFFLGYAFRVKTKVCVRRLCSRRMDKCERKSVTH